MNSKQCKHDLKKGYKDMRKNYFESLKSYQYNEYLTMNPRKKEVLENANIDGRVVILPDSNNRAVTIDDGTKIYLQSYDTLILSVDTLTGEIKKLWDGYSVTTLKHINEFLKPFGFRFNKKEWLNFNGATL